MAVQAKAKIVMQSKGMDWEQEEKMKRKLSSKFWSVALEEWHQISGVGAPNKFPENNKVENL